MESIDKKLLQFQMEIEVIKKDGKNEFFKKPGGKASSYATLPKILAEIKPILNKLNILITQPIVNGEVLTILTCTETDQQKQSGIVIPAGLNAQQTGSAITYYRRYTLSSLLALEIDEDDDGNAASAPQKKQPELKTKSIEKPYLNESSEQFTEAVKFLHDGGTISKIETKYNLSETVKQALIEAVV